MWYGDVVARFKTGRNAGLVTAFITMSGTKDEIDCTTFKDYVHGGNATFSDSYENFHDYGVHWTPDILEWSVDGTVLGLWGAGTKSESASTIQWGGGLIDWSSPDYTTNGYFSVIFESVSVACYNGTTQGTSYVYGANVTGVPSVSLSNLSTQIFTVESTGYNIHFDMTR
ncbi:hypothetical protein RQP46_000267 [Phenoliferia psychrophenolica]